MVLELVLGGARMSNGFIMVRVDIQSEFMKAIFQIHENLINRGYVQRGIDMAIEIIETGALLFFNDLKSYEAFWSIAIESQKFGFAKLVENNQCSGLGTPSEWTINLEKYPQDKSVDELLQFLYGHFKGVEEFLRSNCAISEGCPCLRVEKIGPASLRVIHANEESLRLLLEFIRNRRVENWSLH